METDKIVEALDNLHKAAVEVDKLWDHTGTNMIDGYPDCLPSFDDFVAELASWYLEQKRIRIDHTPKLFMLDTGDYHAEISYWNFMDANAESLDASEIAHVQEMNVGEVLVFGGGSAGDSTLRRIR